MRITVAVCTWNRQELLDTTLAQMQKLRIPKDVEWELLVVNNNCTDNTEKVISHHAVHLPIKRIFEPNPGLSNARNAAVREASGDYILWTDDDVLVDEHWIEAYACAVERWPDVAIFGGPIAPWFEGTPPDWLRSCWSKVSNAYAICEIGPAPVPVGIKNIPFGANYMIRLSDQRKYLYDTALGRKGNVMMGYEETTVICAMLRDGFSGILVPSARVSHFIPQGRQNVGYLKRYFHGKGLYLSNEDEKAKVARLFGYPRWLIREAIQQRLKYQIHRIFSAPDIWVEDLAKASTSWGNLQGIFINRRRQ